MCALAPFAARAESLRDIETRGTLAKAQDGQIAPNIWAGLSRGEALMLINALPDTYASPLYFEIARRFLLSDAPAFSADSAKGGGKDDANRPDVLIARIDKLLRMGALRDARALYDAAVDDIPDNFDLAFRNLEMLMLRGQLSAACLDLQAMQSQHGANPKWKELNMFCRIQFAQGGERERLLSQAKFVELPLIGEYLRGRGAGNSSNMSTESLAYAVATNAIGASSITQLTPRAANMQPLLLSVLLQMDTTEAAPQKTCLAIEAARRGLASTRDLITLYEKPHYEASLLLDATGQVPMPQGLHPCLIPTVLYQRIASNPQQPARDRTIRAALDVMRSMPDAAFWPMALYFRDFDVKAAANKPYLWRATRIVGYEKGELPESWYSGWGGQGGAGVSPFWPVATIMKPVPGAKEADTKAQIDLWRKLWPSEAKRVDSRDPIIPLLLSDVLAGNGENLKSTLKDYENNFSLTFSRSYAMPSYGLTQRLASVIEKGQTGQSVALLLIGYGAIPPDQVFPHQMALVIEGLNKAGLAQYARRFALEVLQ